MRKYAVELSPAARRQLRKLPKNVQKQIAQIIDELAANPRPIGYKQLRGFKGFYRVRSGDFRIIYKIADRILLISILQIVNRRDAY